MEKKMEAVLMAEIKGTLQRSIHSFRANQGLVLSGFGFGWLQALT